MSDKKKIYLLIKHSVEIHSIESKVEIIEAFTSFDTALNNRHSYATDEKEVAIFHVEKVELNEFDKEECLKKQREMMVKNDK